MIEAKLITHSDFFGEGPNSILTQPRDHLAELNRWYHIAYYRVVGNTKVSLCRETLHYYWEFDRDVDIWLKIRDRAHRGSYPFKITKRPFSRSNYSNIFHDITINGDSPMSLYSSVVVFLKRRGFKLGKTYHVSLSTEVK